MVCENCGAELIEEYGMLKVAEPFVGEIVLDEAKYYRCKECSYILYPVDTARRIDDKRRAIIEQKVGDFPISSFISSSDAASLLGVSRQALNKNRRIRRGFVYRIKMSDGCILYHKQSLIQFKNSGDGRFSLFEVWSASRVNVKSLASYESQTAEILAPDSGFTSIRDSTKEIVYVKR